MTINFLLKCSFVYWEDIRNFKIDLQGPTRKIKNLDVYILSFLHLYLIGLYQNLSKKFVAEYAASLKRLTLYGNIFI